MRLALLPSSLTLLALPSLIRQRTSTIPPSSRCLRLSSLNALSPSLMDPIIQHPAISALSIDIRPRSRLKEKHKYLFDGSVSNGSTNSTTNNSTLSLFDELALVACTTGVVCRKELLETYAAATFIHAKFPHMKRMADLAAGHGLLSWFLLALDHFDSGNTTHDNSSNATIITSNMERPRPRTVVCVDRRMPPSADIIASAMIKRFPQLEPRWSYVQSDLSAIVPHPSCVLASVHACGTLTDYLIEMAIGNGTNASPLAIVPCCHTANGRKGYQPHPLSGMDSAEQVAALVEERKRKLEGAEKHEAVADVVDDVRIRTLRNAGYDVEEVMLPEAFTGRNRVLLGVASRPVSSMAMGARSNHTKSNQQQQFFHQRKQQGNNRGMRMPPPPLIRIPLADDNESIAQCHAISGRERATTRLMEQIPKHFSPSLVMSIWLTTASSTSTDTTSSTSQGEIKVGTPAEDTNSSSFGLTVETLQAFADQCCGEVEAEERPIQCAVGVFGEVNVQSTTGRRSQLYRFTYGKPEGAIDLGKASVSRTAAKRIQSMIRERIIDKFGDSVLR